MLFFIGYNMKFQIIKRMINYFQNDVKRINHALKVLSFAEIMGEDESLDQKDREIVTYAAVLHDIGIKEAEKKYGSSIGKYQEIEGPFIARQLLSEFKIPEEIIERACFIIGNHHSYSKIEGRDFQILVEADFLVNIFEDDMGRKATKRINENIFKTESGKKLLRTLYLD